MSWQGNDCFVMQVDHLGSNARAEAGLDDHHALWYLRQLENLHELLWMWQEHGAGWYLLGTLDGGYDEDAYDPFDYDEFRDDLHKMGFASAWYPNPLMEAGVEVVRIDKPVDLMDAAYEMQDSHFDTIGYAGDGDMPFERMVIRGREYNLATCR